MFNNAVQKKVMDQMGEVSNTIKFTGGKTKELIKPCIYLPHETWLWKCYDAAKHPHYLLVSYKKELKALPSVKLGDTSGFR